MSQQHLATRRHRICRQADNVAAGREKKTVSHILEISTSPYYIFRLFADCLTVRQRQYGQAIC